MPKGIYFCLVPCLDWKGKTVMMAVPHFSDFVVLSGKAAASAASELSICKKEQQANAGK